MGKKNKGKKQTDGVPEPKEQEIQQVEVSIPTDQTEELKQEEDSTT
jgi:hypothetical protein